MKVASRGKNITGDCILVGKLQNTALLSYFVSQRNTQFLCYYFFSVANIYLHGFFFSFFSLSPHVFKVEPQH